MLSDESSTQSSSVGAVRWSLPDETVQAHSSAPTMHASKPDKPSQVKAPHEPPAPLRDLGGSIRTNRSWCVCVSALPPEQPAGPAQPAGVCAVHPALEGAGGPGVQGKHHQI